MHSRGLVGVSALSSLAGSGALYGSWKVVWVAHISNGFVPRKGGVVSRRTQTRTTALWTLRLREMVAPSRAILDRTQRRREDATELIASHIQMLYLVLPRGKRVQSSVKVVLACRRTEPTCWRTIDDHLGQVGSAREVRQRALEMRPPDFQSLQPYKVCH